MLTPRPVVLHYHRLVVLHYHRLVVLHYLDSLSDFVEMSSKLKAYFFLRFDLFSLHHTYYGVFSSFIICEQQDINVFLIGFFLVSCFIFIPLNINGKVNQNTDLFLQQIFHTREKFKYQ